MTRTFPLARYQRLLVGAVYSVANQAGHPTFRKLPSGTDPPVRLVDNRWRVVEGSPLCPPPAPDLVAEIIQEPVHASEAEPIQMSSFRPLGIGDECTLGDVPAGEAVLIMPGREGLFGISRGDSDDHGGQMLDFQLRQVANRDGRWTLIPGEIVVAKPTLLVIIAAMADQSAPIAAAR